MKKQPDPLLALRKRVASSPNDPGIYRWLNKDGTVLYVGKAKNLRKRLASYVQPGKGGHGPWRQSFLAQIADFDVTVTRSELEALLLEANLIKQLKPKYNVLLKDDKNYQFVRVTVQEDYPRVEIVRRFTQDGAKYFGPYLSSYVLHQTLDLVHEALGYRACKESLEILNRHGDGVPEKLRQCLDFQIGRCCGTCTGAITKEEYRRRIETVVEFLKGKRETVRGILEGKMKTAAAERKFERAASLRNHLRLLEDKPEEQVASDTTGEDSDILGVAVLSGRAHVVILHRRAGRLTGEAHFALGGQAESAASVLEQFLPQYYEEGREIPPTIILPETVEDPDALTELLRERRGRAVTLITPERGRKSHLLELAQRNAQQKARSLEVKWESEERNRTDALSALQEILKLPEPPHRIEGYDISHLGGTETVGSMVVLRDGKGANDQYRSFTIRTIKSGDIDDYRSIKEVLKRRLRRLTEDLPAEEAKWKEKGVTFGKALARERQRIVEILSEEKDESVDEKTVYKECMVARRDGAIIGCCRLKHHEKPPLTELSCLWTEQSPDAEQLHPFLTRKILRSVKKGKVYVVIPAHKESSSVDLGFRYVITPPTVLEQKMTDEKITMMWEASQNKVDPSLSARPDLLVIDGGKGQLSTAVEALKESGLDIPVIGLAKREEEIFVPGDSLPIPFPKDSPAKFLLMRLRDEAHRFANRHREGRGLKAMKQSALDEIPGIGEATKTELMKRFGSLEGIQSATDQELMTIVNEKQLLTLREYFQK